MRALGIGGIAHAWTRAAAALSIKASSGASAAKLFELRSYVLHPHMTQDYVKRVNEAAALRMRVLPSLIGFWLTETGGALNTVHHMYEYESLAARAEVRKVLAGDAEWAAHLADTTPSIASAQSEVFRVADDVMRAAAEARERGSDGDDAVVARNRFAGLAPGAYEMREYQLVAGYDSVPKLREAFVNGIGSKMRADAAGELAFFGYTELGVLNRVIEIWRYPDAQACLDGRVAARKAGEWRKAIGAAAPLAARFQSSLMVPLLFSPWR